MTIAIYPGTFDPITNGHLDIAIRAAKLFERLIIGVYDTPNKKLLFTTEERVELVRQAMSDLPRNIEVQSYSGLTIDFLRSVGAQVMVRGLRMPGDFEREFDMALMNKRICPECEMVCMMANQDYQFLSSSLLKEVARLDGDIDSFVPPSVAQALRRKVRGKM